MFVSKTVQLKFLIQYIRSALTFSPLYRPVPPALGSPFLRLKPPS